MKVLERLFFTQFLTHTQLDPKKSYLFQYVVPDPKGLKSKLENAKKRVKP
jgi:hypothetical protein